MFYFYNYFIDINLHSYAEIFCKEKNITVEKAQGPVSQGELNG